MIILTFGLVFLENFFAKEGAYSDKLTHPLLAIAFGVFISCATYSILQTHYLPAEADEAVFLNTGKFFKAHSSFLAAEMVDEHSAKFLGANWYGIFYSFYYGALAKLSGNSLIFIFTNLFFTILSAFLLTKIRTEKVNTEKMLLMFFLFPVVFAFTFTFYPEALNIFIGVCLSLLLFRIYENGEAKHTFFFTLMVLAVSLLRTTWIFWLIGLFPFAKTRKEFFIVSFVFLSGMALTFTYVTNFCAPYYVRGGTAVHQLLTGDIAGFFEIMFDNVKRNLAYFFYTQWRVSPSLMIPKYLFLFLAGWFAIKSFQKRNRLVASVALIGLLHVAVLFFMYTTVYPYFLKITASLFLLFIFTIIYLGLEKLREIVFYVFVLSFPVLIHFTVARVIAARKTAGAELNSVYKKQARCLQDLAVIVNQDKDNVVLAAWYDLPFPEWVFSNSIPFSTASGKKIRYTYSVYGGDDNSPERLFRFRNRLNIDYVISKESLTIKNISLAQRNDFFYLYKVDK